MIKNFLNPWKSLNNADIVEAIIAESLEESLRFDDLQTRRVLAPIFSSLGINVAHFPFSAFDWKLTLQKSSDGKDQNQLSSAIIKEMRVQLLNDVCTTKDIQKIQSKLTLYKINALSGFAYAVPSALFFSGLIFFPRTSAYHFIHTFSFPVSFALHSCIVGAIGWGYSCTYAKPRTFYKNNTIKLIRAAGGLLTRKWVNETQVIEFQKPRFRCDSRDLPDSYLYRFGIEKPENDEPQPETLLFKKSRVHLMDDLMRIFAFQKHSFSLQLKPKRNSKFRNLQMNIYASARREL